MLSSHLTLEFSVSSYQTPVSVWSHVIYDRVSALFRTIFMALQYAYAFGDMALRQWCWFSSPIRQKYLLVPSYNIAHLQVFFKCLSAAWRPCPKRMFAEIGRTQGLRITHDLVWKPAVGICLGMSLSFLAEYLKGKELSSEANLLAAARVLRWGGSEVSVKVQTIYEALLGDRGIVHADEVNLFKKSLQDGSYSPDCDKQKLAASLKDYIESDHQQKALRQFVLDDLEKRGEEITPDLYALVLELDAANDLQEHPEERRYGESRVAIMKTLAEYLELKHRACIWGNDPLLLLQNLGLGSYLIHLPNHCIAMVKTAEAIYLFEPRAGFAKLSSVEDQQEALVDLLNYYDCTHSALKVTCVEKDLDY